MDISQLLWNAENDPIPPRHPAFFIAKNTILSVGIMANLSVMLIILLIPALRRSKSTITIISLSVSDFLLCSLTLAFNLMAEMDVSMSKRSNTEVMCTTWLVLTTGLCATSSLTTLAIAVDRLIWISNPLNYDPLATRKRLFAVVILIWISSFSAAYIPTISQRPLPVPGKTLYHLHRAARSASKHQKPQWHHRPSSGICSLSPATFYNNLVLLVTTATPCAVIFIIYIKIYRLIVLYIVNSNSRQKYQTDARLVDRMSADTADAYNPFRDSPSGQEIGEDEASALDVSDDVSCYDDVSAIEPPPSIVRMGSPVDKRKPPGPNTSLFARVSFASSEDTDNDIVDPSQRNTNSGSEENLRRFSLKATFIHNISNTETKAAASLALVTGTSMVCWLPYGVANFIDMVSPKTVPIQIREIFLWLAFSSSCWNPFIYTVINKAFRTSFYHSIVMCCHKLFPIEDEEPPATNPWHMSYVGSGSIATASSFMKDLRQPA